MVIALWVDDGNGPIRNPELSDEVFAEGLATVRDLNVASLWQAAHDYEYQQISGTATGLLAIGVLKQRPVALAIQNWVLSIWNLYYQRKASVTELSDPTLCDFSVCGPMPHSIPELMSDVLNGGG